MRRGTVSTKMASVMHTQKVETLEPFSSHVMPMKMTEAHLGEHLNVMVQALYIQDGTLLQLA